MKVVGLITEYNPFHNGHEYHIKEAKRITGADYVVVVMSGNFVQRGTPAFMDKYTRTRMALECGADIVFELPVCFATSSAEYFAHGAVALLDRLGIVDFICFGSESGDIKALTSLAKILIDEPEEYKVYLNAAVKSGKTFPEARMEAISKIIDISFGTLLSAPNNTLGIEYIKAIINLDSNITPVTITRKIAGYHSEDLTKAEGTAISSATAIRKNLNDIDSLNNLKNHVPIGVFSLLTEEYNKTFPITEEDCSLLLNYRLLMLDKMSLSEFLDINSDLANRISKFIGKNHSYNTLAQQLKSRQWTLTRINRALIHILLGIRKADMLEYKMDGYAQYARVLGFKKESSHLLRQITKNEKIPVITKLGSSADKLNPLGKRMLEKDILAATLYNQIVFYKYQRELPDEYTRGVIISN
ncbi:MAG: hypothetical protein K0S61_196 [Anaerocolumna sp.]|nr:hypothetical protein [Anaerocolumna sp.]